MQEEKFELKGMPHNDDAERVCLGSMLLTSTNIAQVLEHLDPEDFYRKSHQVIFTTIVVLFEQDAEVDP
ncbi:MAG: replicative DNA helicase, partial [Pseudomonadales bacterium]|nr:replicative DNA helicase [Pseudomonadales bacterium]